VSTQFSVSNEVNSQLTWIQTRDGSPTLWSNTLGESYRSTRGAWTESWECFVSPALKSAGGQESKLVEFGLGAGTNWVIWRCAEHKLGLPPSRYQAVERDPSIFLIGKKMWQARALELDTFFNEVLGEKLRGIHPEILESFEEPIVHGSLNELSDASAELWFHDPFGFDVNPDGYSQQTLLDASRVWARGVRGYSYACNRHFVRGLEQLGCQVNVCSTVHPLLKRERLEFYRP
jgi:hypothetical protein